MTYNVKVLRLAVSGTIFEVEGFSWSLNLMANFESDPDVPTAVPTAIINAVSAFHGASSMSTADAKLTTIKLNELDNLGHYKDKGNTVEHHFDTPVPGAGSQHVPAQQALAVTLRTAAKRGRAHAGRFYIPCYGGGPGADGLIGSGNTTPVLTATTTLLNAINAELTDWRVGVVSIIGSGSAHEVTHAELGCVIDTMRSRRKSLQEKYVVGATLAAG
jgi:hypothetical protein